MEDHVVLQLELYNRLYDAKKDVSALVIKEREKAFKELHSILEKLLNSAYIIGKMTLREPHTTAEDAGIIHLKQFLSNVRDTGYRLEWKLEGDNIRITELMPIK